MDIRFIKKAGLRLLIVTIVFACMKLTFDIDQELFILRKALFYYITATILILTTWELSDYLIKNKVKKAALNSLSWISGLKITLVILLIDLPLCVLVYYLANFRFSEILGLTTQNSWTQFRTDVLRALLIAFTISVSNLYYSTGKLTESLENKLLFLEKELSVSKYQYLKNQISPHFLFNSLNTLTSLMYEDRDLASDFTIRLASCYRYILENQDEDLVGLQKELSFLDSFIFMMEVRHKNAVQINVNINLQVSSYLIPTLTLQMLIENALKHNYFSTEKPLNVEISTSTVGIMVKNNLRERIHKKPTTKLGLENIKKRYSFYTNQPVYIEKNYMNYIVVLPFLTDNAEQNFSHEPVKK